MADLPFAVGERVVRYGKPWLGTGVVEECSRNGRIYSIRVRWPWGKHRRVFAYGWHGKTDLRRESYAPKNIKRDQRGDVIIVVDERKRTPRKRRVLGRISGG